MSKEQTQEEFQRCLEIGHTAEDRVTEVLTKAGYNIANVGNQPCPIEIKEPYVGEGKCLHVDLLVIKGHIFWIEVKAVRSDKVFKNFLFDSYDVDWLVEWHKKTKIPPFIVFVMHKDESMKMENLSFHIISIYKVKTRCTTIEEGKLRGLMLIKVKDTIPLNDWIALAQEHPDKWRGIV